MVEGVGEREPLVEVALREAVRRRDGVAPRAESGEQRREACGGAGLRRVDGLPVERADLGLPLRGGEIDPEGAARAIGRDADRAVVQHGIELRLRGAARRRERDHRHCRHEGAADDERFPAHAFLLCGPAHAAASKRVSASLWARWVSIAAFTASGCESGARWPAPSIATRSHCGSVAARRSTTCARSERGARPAHEERRHPQAAIGTERLGVPEQHPELGGDLRHRLDDPGAALGRHRRPGVGADPVPHEVRGAGFELALDHELQVPAGDRLDLGARGPVEQVERGRLDERKAREARSQVARRAQRERAAVGVADEMQRFPDGARERAHDVEVGGACPGVPRTLAVAGEIRRDDAVARREPLDERAPEAPRGRAAVDEQHRRPPADVGIGDDGVADRERGHGVSFQAGRSQSAAARRAPSCGHGPASSRSSATRSRSSG